MSKATPTFAEMFERKRDEQRITQTDLAAQLGVDQKTVSNYEHGRALPWPDKYPAIARFLGIDVATLDGIVSSERDAAGIRQPSGDPVTAADIKRLLAPIREMMEELERRVADIERREPPSGGRRR